MNDMTIDLVCNGREKTINGFDWERLQCKLLKHVVQKAGNEIWSDIFPVADLQSLRRNLQQIGCPALSRRAHNIEIATCRQCLSQQGCHNSRIQKEFRQSLYEYIKRHIDYDSGKDETARHSHDQEIIFVSDDGALIVIRRMNSTAGYEFKSIFLPTDELPGEYRYLYRHGAPGTRAKILKQHTLEKFRGEERTIHYSDNFLR